MLLPCGPSAEFIVVGLSAGVVQEYRLLEVGTAEMSPSCRGLFGSDDVRPKIGLEAYGDRRRCNILQREGEVWGE